MTGLTRTMRKISEANGSIIMGKPADSSRAREIVDAFKAAMAERVVGQEALVEGILTAFIAGGHVLLEGVPGLAKTLAVKTFASIANLSFKRIQFTPDLLPADLVGTLVFEQTSSSFSVRKGPLFANIVLADEINRAPAKVQSALLEAMAERQITIGETTYPLPDPFFVLATQNPIEQEGTYPLPEAELDRFFCKLHVPYPTPEEEELIVRAEALRAVDALSAVRGKSSRAVSGSSQEALSPADLAALRDAVSSVAVDDSLVSYGVAIVGATRPAHAAKGPSLDARADRRAREDYLKYISFGASPRASISLISAARIRAAFEGRSYVVPEDVKASAYAVLRHRLVLSYEAGADGLSADDIVSRVLSVVPVP